VTLQEINGYEEDKLGNNLLGNCARLRADTIVLNKFAVTQ